jgi:PAS domain S-box-containing protein
VTKSLRHAPREELLAELDRLRAQQGNAEELRSPPHDSRALQEEMEEINVQNAQLVEAQHALEDARDRYVNLYDFAPIGYMSLDSHGLILEINLTGASLFGKERVDVQGMPLGGFVASADCARFVDFMRRCRDDRDATTVELSLRAEQGLRMVQLVSRRMSGEPEHEAYLTAMIDITERRRLEDDRRVFEEARARVAKDKAIAQASSEAKDQFLAALSHDLRTPLTPVVAALTDNELWAVLPERQRTAIDVMRRNVDLEVHLIDDLLDETRIVRNGPTLQREPTAAPASSSCSLRILLVEDHPDTAEMLSMLLRHHGFDVEVANSVDAAIDLAGSGFDVLVSDVRLPDGSGMDVIRRLRESRFIRGIAMSGFGTPDDVRRSKEAGYDEHLVKPVDVSRLIEAIYKVAERTH